MRIDVSSVTSHFPNPQAGFTTTTSGSVSSGATTVGLNSTGDYSNGDIIVFIIDPADSDKKQVFMGTVDISGSQITGVVWVGGTNQSHSAGATIVDYYSAAHIRMMTKGILNSLTQAGILKTGAISSAGMFSAGVVDNAALGSSAVDYAKVATGFPVQIVDTMSSAVATGTTTIPFDDTIPQNTEGDEYMTLSITPKSATNKLVIRVTALLSNSAANRELIGALFQDSNANALAANCVFMATATGRCIVILEHEMTAGTTLSTTFKFRAGADAAGTTTFNGLSAGRLFGAITKSSMVITEYKA